MLVDPPGAKLPADERVLVITSFRDTLDLPRKPRGVHELITVNGTSWPGTERMNYTVGDTAHWWVINVSSIVHPRHLHGFYYNVVSRGDVTRDTVYTPEQERKAVTE